MQRIVRRLATRLAPGAEDPAAQGPRTRIGLLEGWTSAVVNTLLFGVKLALGLATGSLALLADAAHTMADSGTSLVVIIGFHMARSAPDKKHPFGHGRMESVAAVVIAALLGVIAAEMGREAFWRLLRPQEVRADWWVVAVIAATLVVKELLARFSFELGRLIDSQALIADAWHHRSDVLATGLVIAAFVGSRWGVNWLDGAMGLGVAALIALAAYATLRTAIDPLLGEPAPEWMYREIAAIARAESGVRDIHDILVHRYGQTNLISLHIEVSDSWSPLRLHRLSERIEERLAARFPGHAIVHVDPVNRDHPSYDRVKEIVGEVVGSNPASSSFHDLRLTGGPNRFRAVLDVTVRAGSSAADTERLKLEVASRVKAAFPEAEVVVNVEPPYFRASHDSDAASGTPGPSGGR